MQNLNYSFEALIYKAVEKAVQKVVPDCLESLFAIAEEKKQSTEMKKAVQPEDRWLNTHEACDMLGCRRTTLWKLTKNGTLKYTQLGSRLRFKLEDVKNLLSK